EFEAVSEDIANQALETFEHCVEQGWVLDGVMSQSEQQLQNLWKLREFISETISHWTPYKNDISVTISQVPAYRRAMTPLSANITRTSRSSGSAISVMATCT